MTNPDDRDAGFYWISIDGQEVEVAQWQTEWGRWLVTGSSLPLSDAISAHVVVLSDLLPPPLVPALRPETAA
jgi:hypothetical protein